MTLKQGTKNPLQPIFAEIEFAINHGLFWLALTSALTIPGICAALERENHWSGRDEYKDWYDRYLSKRFKYLTADDCYGLRCGIVHKATSGVKPKGKEYRRVLFTLPNAQRITIGQGLFDEVLQFDAVRFCREIIDACEEWYTQNSNQEFVKSNSLDIFQYHPDGVAPFIVGMPVLA